MKGRGAVDGEGATAMAGSTWNDDVDAGARPGFTQVPEGGGISDAEERAGAESEHGGHPRGVKRRVRVAGRVDAPVHTTQASVGDAPADRAPAHTGRQELPCRNTPVLPISDGGDGGIGCAHRSRPP
jgi:hypothetical protein